MDNFIKLPYFTTLLHDAYPWYLKLPPFTCLPREGRSSVYVILTDITIVEH